MYKEGVSIYITAYKTKDYIDSTLESIYNQTWFKNHNNWEVVVMCDGDKELYKYLKKKRLKHFRVYRTKKNVGTYIASNTAAKLCKYSWIMRFDSDDIMFSNCVERVMENTGIFTDAIYFKCKRWDRELVACGCVCIKHEIFDAIGGFQPWSCSADTNLKLRLLPFAKIKIIHHQLMEYTVRENSLTTSQDTGPKSILRKQYVKLNNKFKPRTEKDIIIDYITTEYK